MDYTEARGGAYLLKNLHVQSKPVVHIDLIETTFLDDPKEVEFSRLVTSNNYVPAETGTG